MILRSRSPASHPDSSHTYDNNVPESTPVKKEPRWAGLLADGPGELFYFFGRQVLRPAAKFLLIAGDPDGFRRFEFLTWNTYDARFPPVPAWADLDTVEPTVREKSRSHEFEVLLLAPDGVGATHTDPPRWGPRTSVVESLSGRKRQRTSSAG